jgi:molecular chaperone GrpE (heat shock protein)
VKSTQETIDTLNLKIINFQKQILELKTEIKHFEENQRMIQKSTFVELIEWMDLLTILIDDLKSSDSVNRGQSLKSAERLQNRIIRFFKANTINKISTDDSVLQKDGVKIIEVRFHSTIRPGCIIEVIRDGYLWQDQVLRNQEVIAACAESIQK